MQNNNENIIKFISYIFLPYRFATVFAELGLKYGDGVHILTGNNNFTFISMYAAFYLGAFASTGDISLDPDTIAGQVFV